MTDGSSPRVRGTVGRNNSNIITARLIPAGAGNSQPAETRAAFRAAHPRGCGERVPVALMRRPRAGSSPRVWGTDAPRRLPAPPGRLIPAGVGNGRCSSGSGARNTAHPRGCGERLSQRDCAAAFAGSSPRVWGTGFAANCARFHIRLIPAGVGNGQSAFARRKRPTAHPRGCGERFLRMALSGRGPGSSPRVWGTVDGRLKPVMEPRLIPAGVGNGARHTRFGEFLPAHPRGCGERISVNDRLDSHFGSSPRVWGTAVMYDAVQFPARLIPAGVGNGPPGRHQRSTSPAHPRGCGERSQTPSKRRKEFGSSPRVWGTVALFVLRLFQGRLIPAGVGNGRYLSTMRAPKAAHPRGCGERLVTDDGRADHAGSSPRVWGTVPGSPARAAGLRLIPAGVGNGLPATRAASFWSAHPRGCGERGLDPLGERVNGGSSPRVWGTEIHQLTDGQRLRLIPAGVGNGSRPKWVLVLLSAHPRGCGERIVRDRHEFAALGSSPRVWGTGLPRLSQHHMARLIPAGVGNGTVTRAISRAPPAHPRGCGERHMIGGGHDFKLGSSPRVWGTVFPLHLQPRMGRLIPAGVGNGSWSDV